MAAATTAGIDRNVEITSLSHCCPTYVGIMPTASETKLSANCLCCVVQVVVGYLVYSVGQLQYQKLESSGGGDGGDYWIVGSAVVGGAMLTVICIILVVYKRKSTRAQRQFKRLQLQLDSLESNIRNECKQGTRSPPPATPPSRRNSAQESTHLVHEKTEPQQCIMRFSVGFNSAVYLTLDHVIFDETWDLNLWSLQKMK